MTGQQLKNSILQLAIQGKLVPQDPHDEPASELLKRIRKEKEALVKEGKLKKKDLVTTPISDEEKPFDIPESWVWCRLGDVFSMQAGKTIKSSELSQEKDDSHQYMCYGGNGVRGYIGRYNQDGLYPIVGRQGALCGCLNMAFGKFHATEHAVVVTTYSETDIWWSYYFLKALNLNQYATATAQPGLSVANIMQTFIPLPPLAEQHRIVAKIEELMPLVDDYDKAQKELNDLNTNLPEALKRSILQEAIMGKLGTNDPNDEPASELLKRIQDEKAKLVKEKKIKKEKPLPEITEDEKPFDIPENWVWCRLGEIISLLSGQDLTPDRYFATKTGIPYITGASNFENGILKISRWTNSPTSVSHKGDLLITCKGTVGSTAYNTIGAMHIARQVMAISPIGVRLQYIELFLKFIVPELEKHAHSIIPGISRDVILLCPIPLPPLAEQHRIVEKLELILPKLKDIQI